MPSCGSTLRLVVFGGVLGLTAATAGLAAGQPEQNASLPDLPRRAFDRFLPAVRAVVEKAYAAALANPRDAVANGKLGMALQAHSLYAEAEPCYRRAHLLDPSSFQWAYYLGLVLAGEGKCDEAAGVLGQALAHSPEYLPAQLKLGECLLVSGKWDDAGKLYETIIHQHPSSAEAHYGLGRVRAARKDLNGAVESFRKACELFPNYGAAHYALALVYRDLKSEDRAREELMLYSQDKGEFPKTDDPLLDEVQMLYLGTNREVERAKDLARSGKWREAVAAFEDALRDDPKIFEAHVNLIWLYGRLGQPEKAEQHFRAAVRLLPNYPESYFNYGVLLAEQGRFPEAEQAFRKVLEINPYHAEAHNALGDLLQQQGKLAEAKAEFRQAVEDRPNFAQAHFNLGRLLVNEQAYGEGIEHLLKSVETGEEASKATYLYAVGAAYARAGEREKALKYLRQAREQAAAQHQARLVESIGRDLKIVEGAGSSP